MIRGQRQCEASWPLRVGTSGGSSHAGSNRISIFSFYWDEANLSRRRGEKKEVM